MIRRNKRALYPSPPGGALPPRSLTSSQSSDDSRFPKSQHQPRIIAPAPGPVSPLDPSRPRPLASYWGSMFSHSPKHSLGFISTPLRKRPSGGRRPAATRATPSRVEVHVTKPSAPKTGLRSTARPSSRNTTSMMVNRTHTTSWINVPVSTSKPSSFTHTVTINKIPETSRDSETLLGPQASVLSQDSSPRQHKGEVSSSGLSYRKNNPVAPLWLLLSISGGEFQTRNWTDPLEYSSGSDMFMYELGDMYEYDAVSSQEELPAISISRVSKTLTEDDTKESSLNNRSLIEPKFEEHLVIQPTLSLTKPAISSSTVPSLEVSPKQTVAVSVLRQETNNTPDSSLSVGLIGLINSLYRNKDGYIQTTPSAEIRPSPVFHQTFVSSFTASLHPPSSPPPLLGPNEPPSFSSYSFSPLLQFSASPWVSVTSHPSVSPFLSPSSNLHMGFHTTAAGPSLLSHLLLSDSISESQITPGVGALLPEAFLSIEQQSSNNVYKIRSQSNPLSLSEEVSSDGSVSRNSPPSLNSHVENLSEVYRLYSDGSSPSLSPISFRSDLRDLKDVHSFPEESRLGHLSDNPARLQPELLSASLSSSLSDIFLPAFTQSQIDSPSPRMSMEMSPPSLGNLKHVIGNPALFLAQTSAAGSQIRLSFTRSSVEEPFIQPSAPSINPLVVPPMKHHRTTRAQPGIPAPQPNNSLWIPNVAHIHQPPFPSVSPIPPAVSFPSPTPVAFSRATLATVSMTDAEIDFLSPTAVFLNKHFQTPHRADTQPVERFISLSGKQSSTVSGDDWEAIPSQFSLPARDAESDGGSSHPANSSMTANASRIDSMLNRADVVPKMLPAEEQVSDARVSSTAGSRSDAGTMNGMLEAGTGHLNAASKHIYNPSIMDASQQPTAAVTTTPLLSSDTNPAASRSPTSSSIHAPDQDFMFELKELSVSGNADTVASKNSSKINKDIIQMLKDTHSVPAEVTNSTRAKNASEDPSVSGNSAAAKPSLASDPSLWNHGAFLKPPAAPTSFSSSAAPFGDTSLTTLRPALSVDPCPCKRTFDFPCLCGESSGNSMSKL
ncbi:hypothetical protein GOODEAATRI_024362 [Goodea atripinnis]|uniref:Uncharacterized protein n=1 Tax=Goodea atripinnis TaxID=208336 RepID=A0ABV0MUS1_9TELE